jgi:hypothetical protein
MGERPTLKPGARSFARTPGAPGLIASRAGGRMRLEFPARLTRQDLRGAFDAFVRAHYDRVLPNG